MFILNPRQFLTFQQMPYNLKENEIILLEDIRNLGNTGQIVKVKDGYGRNFLLKTGKALRLNKENL